MFKNLEAITPDKHAELRFSPSNPYHFARELMLTPVAASEASHIARDYVLVFPLQRDELPQALLGTQAGVNAYVGDKGHWLCRYVPAHIRRYPFMAGQRPDEQGDRRFALMADMDAPHFTFDGKMALFDEGQPTDLIRKVQKVLANLQRDFEAMQRLAQQIDDFGLLVPRKLHIPRNDSVLEGFRLVDRDRLSALSGEDLKALHDSGALALIHAHLVSLNNLEDGMIARRTAAAPETTMSLEELFSEGDDDFFFDFDS
ncbi:MAG: SapC family protein [Pseudomonadota bacterium]